MGNEMGNNNTSAIIEEDYISEGEKNNLLEDPSEHANVISQDVHADCVKEENQNIPTSLAKDVIEKSSNDSNDLTIEHGKDTSQEDGHADEVKGKIQTIPTDEAKDDKEKAAWLDSNNTTSMLENDSLERDLHASEINTENRIIPTGEAEDVQEKATELVEFSLQEESHGDGVKEETQMIPTAEDKDVEEKTTGLISNNTESMLENNSLEEDTHESEVNIENQMHPIYEAEDFQDKATGMASDHTISSLENEALKGKDDQEIAARFGYDDKTSELEGKPQEDKQDGDIRIPITNGTDVQEKSTILASNDPLNLTNSFGEEMTGVTQPEMSPYAESIEGENFESLSSSSMEGTEECGKQEDSCLRKHLSLTYNHHLNDESSIKQDAEEAVVLTLNAVNKSNDSELQESPSVHHDELVKSLSEHSLQSTESLPKDTLLDADPHVQLIKDDVLEKDMESQEELLCSNKSDGNEYGNGLIVINTSEATSVPPSTGINNNDNLLTKVNYTTDDDSPIPFTESFVVDNSPKSDQEENCKLLSEENRLSRCGSKKENSKDQKPDQCMKELNDYINMVNTYDMTIGSKGDCNGERHTILDSSVFEIANSDQVEEPKLTENGLQLDESSAAPQETHSLVPEAVEVFLIAGSVVADCIHDKGENHNNKIEDTKENPEASYAMVKALEETDMSDQCNSVMITTDPEEYFFLQNCSLVTNDSKYFGATVKKLDSSMLTVPSLDLVDEEAIEKESKDYSQHAEATSLIVEELTTSAATMSTEPFSRDSVTRFSTESNTDNPNITCQIQKSPSFNLDLRIEARPEESDQDPLLSLSNSMFHAEYDRCMLHTDNDMPVEEKIVTMERSYSEVSKASFKGFLKEEGEEEIHLLEMEHTQDNHGGTNNNAVKEVSPKGREKRKYRSYFFSSCMCCATVTN